MIGRGGADEEPGSGVGEGDGDVLQAFGEDERAGGDGERRAVDAGNAIVLDHGAEGGGGGFHGHFDARSGAGDGDGVVA